MRAARGGEAPVFAEPTDVDLGVPDFDEVLLTARCVATAIAPPDGLTSLQVLMLNATVESLTGFAMDCSALEPAGADDFAAVLARRDRPYRSRIVQLMVLGIMVVRPLPREVPWRVRIYARAVGIDDEPMMALARDFANGHLGLAMIDFERAGYRTEDWGPGHRHPELHTSRDLEGAWEEVTDDPALAERWASLEHCAEGTLGLGVWRLYRSRGFRWPGTPGSAPPYLAQHDWVHVLADYGTTLECELEVFGLISRAIDDPRGFSFLAMVVSLFETGYLLRGAGLFEHQRGHLSTAGAAMRLADAMRRGSLVSGAHVPGRDLLAVDWFAWADLPLAEARERAGIVPKSVPAITTGSVGPQDAGSMTAFQDETGRAMALADGRPYESWGATPANR